MNISIRAHVCWIGLIIFSFPTAIAQCSFELNASTVCSGDTISVVVQNPEANATYQWDFNGDGLFDDTGRFASYAHPFTFANTEFILISLFKDSVECSRQEVEIRPGPDPTLGVDLSSAANLKGQEIAVCNQPENFRLTIFNNSVTAPVNTEYEIDWGDNSPVEILTPNQFSGLVQHEYLGLGFKLLNFKVTRTNGCSFTQTYNYYNGRDPSVGLGKPANTTGLCAPEVLTFSFSEIDANPPGTLYEISINGASQLTFEQDDVPNTFDLLFETSSCNARTSTGKFNNAFDVEARVSNPCATSTATVEPIELSGLPEPIIGIDGLDGTCPGSVFFISNASTEINDVESGNPSVCRTELPTSWSISGTQNVDWVILEGNPFNSQRLAVRFNNEGSYTITMTMRSSACGLVEIQEELVIAGEPNVSISLASDNNCAGDIFEAVVNGAGAGLEYNWEIRGENNGDWSFEDGTNSNSQIPKINFADADRYRIDLSITNGCTDITWDTTISVAGRPEAVLLPQPIACQQAVLNFSETNFTIAENGTPVTSYDWIFEGSNMTSSKVQFPTGITFDSPGIYPFSVQLANACGTTTVTDTLQVNAPANLQLPSDQIICQNTDTFTLMAIPSGGSWTGMGINPDGLIDPANLEQGINTFLYEFGEGACEVTGSVNITIEQTPTIELGQIPDAVCESVDGVFLVATPANGIWTVEDGGVLNGITFSPKQSGAGSYQLTYTVNAGNGCSSSASTNLLVNALPNIEVADTALCNLPGLTNLPLAIPLGGSWTGPGITNNQFDPVVAGGIGNYQLTYIFDGGQQCVDSAIIQVQVNAPAMVNAGPNDTFCIDGGLINLSRFSPASGSWSGPGISDETIAVIDPALTGGGTFNYVYALGEGNCRVEDQKTVTIIDLGSTTAGRDESICLNAPPKLLEGAFPVGGQWSGPGIVDAQQGLFQADVLQVGQQEIFYTFRDENSGCFFRATKLIEVLPTPQSSFVIPSEACIGDTLLFLNNSNSQFLPNWSFGDGNSSGDISPVNIYRDTGVFEVVLTTENELACVDSSTQEIFITEAPDISFEKDINGGCAPLTVNFSNLTSGYNTTYQWVFGNGQQTTEQDPDAVTYRNALNDTTFFVSLRASNLCGSVLKEDSIQLLSKPTAAFGLDRSSDCTPMTIDFSNITQGNPDEFSWDLGNGRRLTDSLPPRQIYTTDTLPSIYTITLVASNECGRDTLNQELLVRPVEVKSFFNIFDTVGCQPYVIQFTDFSTPGAFVRWDFGDGNSSSLPNPLHTYNEAGTFEVIQRASNGCGYDSTIQRITVLPAPEVSFEHLPEICIGDTLQLTNNSINTAGDLWDFGDGDSSFLESPFHIYQTAGDFNISLRGISRLNGCEERIESTILVRPLPEVAFTTDKIDGCIPLRVSFQNQSNNATYYSWDFSDGNNSVGENPEHTFSVAGEYPIKLTATDAFGCANDTLFFRIIAYPQPEVDFELEKEMDCGAPVTVFFEGISDQTVGYNWSFGDGSTDVLRSPAHIFQDSGQYNIELEVRNTFGCLNQITRSLNIIPQPVADFISDPIDGCSPLLVDFINRSEKANRYTWLLGDGNVSTAVNPSYIYSDANLYQVTLIASYDDACFDTLNAQDIIEVLPSPIAAFDYEEELTDGPAGIFNFINQSEGAIRFSWDFGDGTIKNNFEPTHRFFSNGPKEVTLRVENRRGCQDDTTILLVPSFLGYLHVPNALAPDQAIGDASIFLPKGLGLAEYHLQIFSAYGDLIWESRALKDGQPAEGWNGTKDGQPLPQDTYLWKIKARFEDGGEWPGLRKSDGKQEPFGTFILLR